MHGDQQRPFISRDQRAVMLGVNFLISTWKMLRDAPRNALKTKNGIDLSKVDKQRGMMARNKTPEGIRLNSGDGP